MTTDTILAQKDAVIGVLATEGFQDTLEMGRQHPSRMYDLDTDAEMPIFLAPCWRRLGMCECLRAHANDACRPTMWRRSK